MRKNWLAAAWTRRFRARPVVPDAAFQDATEPCPGHWRQFPDPWPAVPAGQLRANLHKLGQRMEPEVRLVGLPEMWRQVVTARAATRGDDRKVADEHDLTLAQERDVLARVRAAGRDRLDRTRDGLR